MGEADDNALLAEISARRGWSFRRLDGGIRWITGDDGAGIALPAGHRPLNSQAASVLAADKAACAILLREAGIGTPEQVVVDLEGLGLAGDGPAGGDPPGRIPPEAAPAWRQVARRVEALGYPVFVKPATGSRGQLARRIPDEGALRHQLSWIGRRFRRAVVQPFVRAPEYRLFWLDGRLEFLYRRLPPAVVGDGRRTLRQLVDDLDRELPEFDPEVGLDRGFILEQILAHGVTWTTPLPAGLTIELSGVGNLWSGARLVDFARQGPPGCEAWLERLARTLGLRLCAVDLFSPSCLADPTDFLVIDVNSNPHWSVLRSVGQEAVWREVWERVLERALASQAALVHSWPTDR